MNDMISRQTAIDTLRMDISIIPYAKAREYVRAAIETIYNRLEELPSAEPERLTDDDFETIRIHLNAQKEKLCNQQRWEEAEEYQRIIDRFMAFASAESEQWETCFDCPLSHGCPVINGCTNEQAMEYAGKIPDNCPLNKKSVELDASDRNVGMWVSSDSQCGIGCPFCGKPVDDFCNSIDYIDLLYEPNFCPNCGAKLKGGKL